jgi:hypothetical protein
METVCAASWCSSCCQSVSVCRASCVRHRRRPLFCKSWCSGLHRSNELWMANVILRSSPSNFCHCKRVVCRLLVNVWRRCVRRSTRCGGRCMVRAALSMSQPRIRFRVPNVASPFRTLDWETIVRRGESVASWKMVKRCWRRLFKVAVW